MGIGLLGGVLAPVDTVFAGDFLASVDTELLGGVLAPVHNIGFFNGGLASVDTGLLGGALAPVDSGFVTGGLASVDTGLLSGVLAPVDSEFVTGILASVDTGLLGRVLAPKTGLALADAASAGLLGGVVGLLWSPNTSDSLLCKGLAMPKQLSLPYILCIKDLLSLPRGIVDRLMPLAMTSSGFTAMSDTPP